MGQTVLCTNNRLPSVSLEKGGFKTASNYTVGFLFVLITQSALLSFSGTNGCYFLVPLKKFVSAKIKIVIFLTLRHLCSEKY